LVQPQVIIATEDKPLLVVQNSTVDENYVATASMDGVVRIYDNRDGSLIRSLTGHASSVNGVLITPNNAYVVSCSGVYISGWQKLKILNGDNTDNSIRIWDLPTGRQLFKLPLPNAPTICHYLGVSAITTNDAATMLVSGGYDNAVCLWDSSTGKLLFKFGGLLEQTTVNGTVYVDSGNYHAGAVTALSTYTQPSETGLDLLQRAVSTSDDGSFRVWDIGVSSVTAFTQVACVGPVGARCQTPNLYAHTMPVICMAVLNIQPSRQLLITGKSTFKVIFETIPVAGVSVVD
jgi:WD40 repeat protein